MYIDCESVYSSSSAVKQTSKTLRKTINLVPLFFFFFFHPQLSSLLKMSSFCKEENIFQSINLTCWRSTNHCIYDSLLPWIQGLERFYGPRATTVISKILHPLKYPGLAVMSSKWWKIHSQLFTMFTFRDGKDGKLSGQASKMLCKRPGAVYIAS